MKSSSRTLLPFIAVLASACQSTSGVDPASEPEIRVIRLEHTEAVAMAATLKELLADGSPASGAAAVLVEAHAATNSLLVSGSDERIAQVIELVGRLDVPQSY